MSKDISPAYEMRALANVLYNEVYKLAKARFNDIPMNQGGTRTVESRVIVEKPDGVFFLAKSVSDELSTLKSFTPKIHIGTLGKNTIESKADTLNFLEHIVGVRLENKIILEDHVLGLLFGIINGDIAKGIAIDNAFKEVFFDEWNKIIKASEWSAEGFKQYFINWGKWLWDTIEAVSKSTNYLKCTEQMLPNLKIDNPNHAEIIPPGNHVYKFNKGNQPSM